jgi:hypothetical protein
MPRSNRPRRSRAGKPDDRDAGMGLFGGRHIESKRDGDWYVQSIAAASAVKTYACPGCGIPIAPGTGHVVAWRADGLMGEADDIAARRHWHSHCWKIK